MLVSLSSTLSGPNFSQNATLVLNQSSASHYFRQSLTHIFAMLSISNETSVTCFLRAAVGIISAFKVSDCLPVLQLSLPVHSPCSLFLLFVPSARAELAAAAGAASELSPSPRSPFCTYSTRGAHATSVSKGLTTSLSQAREQPEEGRVLNFVVQTGKLRQRS